MAKLAEAEAASFVQWFRAATPYIHAFRDKTFVLAFGGDAMLRDDFVDLVYDINLLNALGVRLVLVHGVRPQVEERLAQEAQYVQGRRVTDSEALEHVKDAVGSVRVDIESLLSVGLPNTPMAGAEIRVDSGNYVTAQPAGVRAVGEQHGDGAVALRLQGEGALVFQRRGKPRLGASRSRQPQRMRPTLQLRRSPDGGRPLGWRRRGLRGLGLGGHHRRPRQDRRRQPRRPSSVRPSHRDAA
jgi:hypothetical protein